MKKRSKVFKVVLTIFLVLVFATLVFLIAEINKADEVYYGKINTMDAESPLAEAATVKAGKISWVGKKADAPQHIGLFTKVKDFGEDYIYPGFLDGHAHLGLFSSMEANGTRLEITSYLKDNAEIMKSYIEANPGREVYKGYGWWNFPEDPNKPTHEVLDKYASNKVPIVIVDGGGHIAILNQKAIEYYDLKNKISVYGTDGIEVDANGNPTGLVRETPRFDIIDSIAVSKDDLKDYFLWKQNDYIKQGYTTIMDAGLVETEALPQVTALKELAQEGKLKLRVRAYMQISETDTNKLEKVDQIAKMAREINLDKFKIVGVKIFLDGTPEGSTTWTSQPYLDKSKGANYTGYHRWTEETKSELIDIIKSANKQNLMVHFHSMGEGAISYALDCFEAARAGETTDYRNGMCHLSQINDADFKRFVDNKIIAFVGPHWSSYKVGTKEEEQKIYGNKALNMYQIKTFLDRGVLTSFHTDGMCQGGVPEMIFSATTRLHPIAAIFDDGVRGLDERISAMDSLRCLTTTTAYSMKEEYNLGSIAVGKAADFVVYDKDFMENEVAQSGDILNATLKAVISNGQIVYPFSEL